MEFKGVKLNIVVLVAIIVILSFFAGKHLLNIYNVKQPLINELSEIDGIKNVKLIEKNNQTNIKITLQPGNNLYQTYKNVNNISSSQLGKNKGEIIIENTGNEVLEETYYKLHYALYEGIATSKFSRMKNEIAKIVEQNNLSNYRLWIDSNNIYLELIDNNSAYYKIIPRKNRIVLNQFQGGESSG